MACGNEFSRRGALTRKCRLWERLRCWPAIKSPKRLNCFPAEDKLNLHQLQSTRHTACRLYLLHLCDWTLLFKVRNSVIITFFFKTEKIIGILVNKHSNWTAKNSIHFHFSEQLRRVSLCSLSGKERGEGRLLSGCLQFSVSLVVTVISGKDLNHALFVPLGYRDVRSLSPANRFWGQKRPFLYCCCWPAP